MRDDWIEVKLGDILEIERGGSPRPIKQFLTNSPDGINWIKIGDTKNATKYIERTAEKIKPSGLKKSRLVKEGDFLLSNSMSFGRPYIMKTTGAIHDGWLVLRNKTGINTNKDYLYHVLSSPFVYNQFEKLAAGSTVKNLNIGLVSVASIPLPPLSEQRAIVAKIEQLFSDLDNGIRNLKEAKEKLSIYRQSVLKKAFEGELTRQWRSKQTDLPTADDLLQQIKEERQRHYDQQLEEWKQAVSEWETNHKEGKKPGKPKVPKQTTPLTEEQIDKLFQLSSDSIWIKIGDLTLKTEYGSSAKSLDAGDIPVLRMGNIQNGRFDWTDLVYSTDEEEIKKYTLQNNDVLFNRTNSPELVGKTAIYKAERPAIFAGYLIRVNQIQNLCNADYLNHYLNSHPAKVHGNSVKTDGVNQSNINGEKLKNYPFPYCSTQEQIQIVQEIESRLSVCDKLEQAINNSLKQAEALRQSILKRAFEGNLLTESELTACRQEPDWEPAEKLLERIKAESKPKKSSKKKANK